ncbi:PREDICTED: GPI transamidase component PIG-S [Nicrophorus vespilloides]|uniref:GPI transamidase component PIG-S n=1 Tax=Nicrophorus vespilloides TaxID=110193 RepID=A0ABM1M9V4_NICVS|nr:PREDICTED: GPI transamidase component PIG-S [Nicrophorus vespilloides]
MSSKVDRKNNKDDDEVYDDDQRIENDPEAKYRVYSVIYYFIVLVVIGVPVWWYTTRVYRAPLPINDMINVEIPSKTIRENSLPLSLEYDVLITLINPEPQNLNIDLKAEDLKANLQPFLTTITPIANFTVKSQWLYLTDLGVTPKDYKGELVLFEEQLPHIITPLEKKIWSHMSPRPCLNLVLYFTKCNSPIYLYNNMNQKVDSNAFLSPRWGGISVINADSKSCKEKRIMPNLKSVIGTFLIQLKELFGLKDIEVLKKTKATEMVESTRRTLKSLAQLLSEINSIVISDEVATKIENALKYANEADAYLKENNINEALKASQLAFKNSEEAFSDPSLLALLYFPDDQKYAVYIPLFLPIMIPVFMSLTSVNKYYKSSKAKLD